MRAVKFRLAPVKRGRQDNGLVANDISHTERGEQAGEGGGERLIDGRPGHGHLGLDRAGPAGDGVEDKALAGFASKAATTRFNGSPLEVERVFPSVPP